MKTILETDRTYLREMVQTDFGDLCEILQDPEVMYAYQRANTDQVAFTDTEVQDWLNKQLGRYKQYGFGLWAVIDKNNSDFIGQVGLTMQNVEGKEELEIGYLLKQKFWHKGYATETAIACKEYAFNCLKKDRVVCIIRDNNYSSLRVAERIGMKFESKYVKRCYDLDMTHFVYSIKIKEQLNK